MSDIHDTSDGRYWRGLTVDQLLAAVAEQIEPQADGRRVDDDYARSITGDAIRCPTDTYLHGQEGHDDILCNGPDRCFVFERAEYARQHEVLA